MLPAMKNFFALVWLVIALGWAYKSISQRNYVGLVLAAGFVLLAIFSFQRK
jgi:hypothetical protein